LASPPRWLPGAFPVAPRGVRLLPRRRRRKFQRDARSVSMNSRSFAPVWARSSSVAGGSSGFGSTRHPRVPAKGRPARESGAESFQGSQPPLTGWSCNKLWPDPLESAMHLTFPAPCYPLALILCFSRFVFNFLISEDIPLHNSFFRHLACFRCSGPRTNKALQRAEELLR
jgi:hypothetical protein